MYIYYSIIFLLITLITLLELDTMHIVMMIAAIITITDEY
jgi:hypothetical protein